MDPNQTTGTTSSGINDIDPIGSDSGAGVTPTGLTGANDATETAPTQRVPPIGISSQDRSLPINQTAVPERTGARVWNRPGDRSSSEDLTRSQSRPISPTPLAQTRGELTELRGMMTTLIDEIRSQQIANQAIANRLDQAERELAEHRAASIRERNQTLLDPLRTTSNPQSTGLFGTPEIPSALSGRYVGENLQRPPPQGMTQRSLSYSGLDEIDTGLQYPRSTPIQFQNGLTERQGEPRTRISPPNHSIPENRTPSATRTFHQAGFNNPTEQARRHDLRGPVNIDPQREKLGIPVTPKVNRKAKATTNKRGREVEQESPNSPPPAPKKRVDMISWGQNSNATYEIKKQTEGKIRFEISVAIRTLENPDEVTPPPCITPYNPNTKPPSIKVTNFKRKNKMTKIREQLEKPIQKQDRMQTLNRNLSGGRDTTDQH
ncbi:hypothetical protein DY000_02003402 [Brassica cretica]|uniref:Uncharacterized protein n=1 Tax=Brassica cretica TaxID=69181 RepID=A0ABQ7CGB5_BRACR|nr:hypothetical protein DY000_02003402 [Brassica cretica]